MPPVDQPTIQTGTRADRYTYPAVDELLPAGFSVEDAAILLRERPFTPTDRSLLSSFYYRDTPPNTLAPGPSTTEAEIEQELRALLTLRFPEAANRVDATVALFHDVKLKAQVPDCRLRAAMLALTGTILEPGIAHFQERFVALEFADLADPNDRGESNTEVDALGVPRNRILVNRTFQHESFIVLSTLIAHELLHDDASISRAEEQIAYALQTVVHLQQLLTDPAIARSPWQMAREYNTLALGRLMSGVGAQMRLYESDGIIFPGSGLLTPSFAVFLDDLLSARDLQATSEGTDLLAEVLALLVEAGHTPPQDAAFDDATLVFIDANHAPLGPRELLAAACVLELDVPVCRRPEDPSNG